MVVKLQNIFIQVMGRTNKMDEKEFRLLRKEVAQFMRRLYKRGLTTASGGNISVRCSGGILITPSSLDKGRIKSRQVGLIAVDGQNLTPGLKPSIEYNMHLAIYRKRKDVNAIVHAHPTVASTFTALMHKIDCTLIAEARAILGTPAFAPYALMGTEQLATEAVLAAEENTNVILLENHGIVCLGDTLLTAFDRMEVLEAAAKMTIIAKLMGEVTPLSEEQLKEIDGMMK